jgi:hypothetical protein
MTDAKLSEREENGLLELCLKHGLITIFRRPQDATNSEAAALKAIAFGRELLLAAKEQGASVCEQLNHCSDCVQCASSFSEAIRAADFGPMFNKLGRTQP